MQHALWKLTALAGVVGIGLLVVMQAQQGLSTRPATDTVADLASTGEPETGEPSAAEPPADPSSTAPSSFGPESFRSSEQTARQDNPTTSRRPLADIRSTAPNPQTAAGVNPFSDEEPSSRPSPNNSRQRTTGKPPTLLPEFDDDQRPAAVPLNRPQNAPPALADRQNDDAAFGQVQLVDADASNASAASAPGMSTLTDDDKPSARPEAPRLFTDEEDTQAPLPTLAAPAGAAGLDPFSAGPQMAQAEPPTTLSEAPRSEKPASEKPVSEDEEDDAAFGGFRQNNKPLMTRSANEDKQPEATEALNLPLEPVADPALNQVPNTAPEAARPAANAARPLFDDDDMPARKPVPPAATEPNPFDALGQEDPPALQQKQKTETAAPPAEKDDLDIPFSKTSPTMTAPANGAANRSGALFDEDEPARSEKPLAVPANPPATNAPLFGEDEPIRRPQASPAATEDAVPANPASANPLTGPTGLFDDEPVPSQPAATEPLVDRPAAPRTMAPEVAPATSDDDDAANFPSLGPATPTPPILEPEPATEQEPAVATPPANTQPANRPASDTDDDSAFLPNRESSTAPALSTPADAQPQTRPDHGFLPESDNRRFGQDQPDERISTPQPQPQPAFAPEQPAFAPEPEIATREPAMTRPAPIADDSDFNNRERSDAEPRADRRAPEGSQRPQVTIEKIAPRSHVLGQPMVYQIVIHNTGTSPAHEVVVEDRIPRSVQLNGTIPQAELANGSRLIWKLGTVEPNQQKKISVRVIPTEEGTISSVATVNFAADVEANTVVKSAPRLQFEITAPPQAAVGAPVVFNYRVTNVGRVDATGVLIRNLLPNGLRHPDGDDLEYEVGDLPTGTFREVQLTLTAAQAGHTVNKAVVTADGGLSVPAQAEIDVRGDSLKVTRSGPSRVRPNRTAVFRNSVTNTGTVAVQNVSIVETLPAGMEVASTLPGAQYDAGRRSVIWTMDRIEPGETKNVEITVNCTGRGPQVSVVRVSEAGGASGETMKTANIAGVATLSVSVAELPTPVEIGEQVPCKVRVFNRGTDTARNVRVSVTVPHGLKLLSIRGPVKYQQQGTEVSFDALERLEARREVVFELTLEATGGGDARMQATVQSDQMSQPLHGEEATIVLTRQ